LARDTTFRFEARTNGAGFDVPAYFRGKVNGDVIASRAAGAPIAVGGNVAIEHARIPVNALYNPNAAKNDNPLTLPIAFDDLAIAIGQDVRVQSSVIDVGARGKMTIAGTIARPQLTGAFDATGGTVNVYHDFRVVRGHVAFSPDQGLMPTVNAVATTSISNPPTDVTLHITGTVPNLDLSLSSDPQYSRAQILGLLLGVQALGAVQNLPQTGGATQAFNAGTLAENEAEDVLRAQLTRGIFEPLQSSLGNALGFNNLQLYLNDTGGFEAHASKGLAKHVNAVFGETFGPVSKQIIGVRATPTDALSLQATYYQQEGAVGFAQYNPSYLQALSAGEFNQALNATTSSTGTNGYSFSVQRRYP
jgi:autotransporter translocation and assembly factor TamB